MSAVVDSVSAVLVALEPDTAGVPTYESLAQGCQARWARLPFFPARSALGEILSQGAVFAAPCSETAAR